MRALATTAAGMLSYVSGQQDLPELNAFLAGIPFFAPLDEAIRLELAAQLEPVHVAAGDVIFREGDVGDGLFLVISGRLRVTAATGRTGRDLNDLGRGAIVGEIALLSDKPRSATVHAVRDSDLLLLRVSSFKSLVERSPAVLAQMAQLLIDRLLTADRTRTVDRLTASPAARTIAVATAGRSIGSAALVADQLAAELARTGSVFRLDADVVARHLGRRRRPTGTGRSRPGRADWLAARGRTRP